jgi:hypothetical protein
MATPTRIKQQSETVATATGTATATEIAKVTAGIGNDGGGDSP